MYLFSFKYGLDLPHVVSIGDFFSDRHGPASCPQLFQSSILIMDIATYRLNQPKGQCSENHLICITRWEGKDGVTITIFFSAYKGQT